MDQNLVIEATKLCNGSNVHNVNNLIQSYYWLSELANTKPEFTVKTNEVEKQLRIFVIKSRLSIMGMYSQA